jgi:hypothetical protein
MGCSWAAGKDKDRLYFHVWADFKQASNCSAFDDPPPNQTVKRTFLFCVYFSRNEAETQRKPAPIPKKGKKCERTCPTIFIATAHQ